MLVSNIVKNRLMVCLQMQINGVDDALLSRILGFSISLTDSGAIILRLY